MRRSNMRIHMQQLYAKALKTMQNKSKICRKMRLNMQKYAKVCKIMQNYAQI